MRPFLLFFAFATIPATFAGCNGVAGISDLITADRDGSLDDGGSTDASAEGSTGPDASAEAAVDAGPALDADIPPICSGTNVGLRITVAPSTDFTGVRDTNNAIVVAAGTTYSHCFALHTQIELQADPDMSNASHDWGTPLCAAGRRCAFSLDAPTAIDVAL